MEKLVEIFPNELTFSSSKNKSFLESKIKVKNLTNKYVIFKLFNNNANLYSVKPSKSFLPPKETKEIYIKRFSKEVFRKPEIFMLMFYSIDKIINNNDEVKEALNSKLFKPETKQECMISVVINDDENIIDPAHIYKENDLVDDQNDIHLYKKRIADLKNEYNKTNNNIIQLEKILEVIKTQRQLKNEKDRAIGRYENKDKSGLNIIKNNVIIIAIILLGLIFGANLANKYNKLFLPKKRIIKQIIINQSDNFIDNKIDEINIKLNKASLINGDFLNWKFLIVLYLCMFGFIV